MGIRLYEVLQGISIQGGIDRQSKYDSIIGGILQWKDMKGSFSTKQYPELKELYDFCQENFPDTAFERLWIDTKGIREGVEKKEQYSKLKRNVLITATALSLVLG